MKTEQEIREEIKRRAKYALKQNESYGSYRANMNIIRGLLWTLNYPYPINHNLNTVLKQFVDNENKTKGGLKNGNK